MRFKDRIDAGKQLANALQAYAHDKNVVVLGLPRGGVPLAYEVAKALSVPLDIIIVRKIGAPHNPELAVGALVEDGTILFNEAIMHNLGLTPEIVQPTIDKETGEAERRKHTYIGDRARIPLKGKTVIIVDDGVATGATIRAAVKSARAQGAQKIIVAVPVAPRDTLALLRNEADEVICLHAPDLFFGVGAFYDAFGQTQDEEVIDILHRHPSR